MIIQERLAAILRQHGALDDEYWNQCVCGAPTPWAEHVAEVLTTELDLTEFTCDGHRWWSTKIEPIA